MYEAARGIAFSSNAWEAVVRAMNAFNTSCLLSHGAVILGFLGWPSASAQGAHCTQSAAASVLISSMAFFQPGPGNPPGPVYRRIDDPTEVPDDPPGTGDPCEGNPDPCCPVNCDDGDPCTQDICTEGNCEHPPIDCDDHNPCTIDSCQDGSCIHTPKDCADEESCTIDSCDPVTGNCVHVWMENDGDIDCDGIPNEQDGDVDGDGIPNSEDDDIDGDGIPNGEDGDVDGDGRFNAEDEDIDGDGIPNDQDDDVDGDGIPNDLDGDDDGDGIFDGQDETPGGCQSDCPRPVNLIAILGPGEADENTYPGVIVLPDVDDSNNNGCPDYLGPDRDRLLWEWSNFTSDYTLVAISIDRAQIPLNANWSVTLDLQDTQNVPPYTGPTDVVHVLIHHYVTGLGGAEFRVLPNTVIPPTVFSLPPTSEIHDLTLATLAADGLYPLFIKGLIPGGRVEFRLQVRDPNGILRGEDQVLLSVAPFILLPNTAPAESVLVSGVDPDFEQGIRDLVAMDWFGIVITSGSSDVWTQDSWEFGITARYDSGALGCNDLCDWDVVPLAFETLRAGRPLQEWGRQALLGPRHEGLYYRLAEIDNDLAYGGNVEVTPPLPGHPLGRIVVGEDMPALQKDFLARQHVQAPLIELDTSWLVVGHVDEFVNFAPDFSGEGNWRVVFSDTELAFDILQTVDAREPLFYCAQDTEFFFGEATGGTANTLVDNNPGVDFTQGEWQYIRIYDGHGKGQIGEIESVTANTIVTGRTWLFENVEDVFDAITADADTFVTWTGWPLNHIPQGPGVSPNGASQYVLVSCSKLWLDRLYSNDQQVERNSFPALTTAVELRSDARLTAWNSIAQSKIITQRSTLNNAMHGAVYGMSLVPALYIGDPAQGDAFAYVPGIVNFQVWNPYDYDNDAIRPAQLWLPMPLGPRFNGLDLFEQYSRQSLAVPGGVYVIDNWETYHRALGEVHCGTNVVRVARESDPYDDWWNHLP